MIEQSASAKPRPAQMLDKSFSMRITTAILWVSIFLPLLRDDLLATTTEGGLLSIYDHIWVTAILLQFANLWLRRMFDIVLFDYDWLFPPFVKLIYGIWSNLPMSKPKPALREAVNPSIVFPPVSTSLISSVPILPPLVTHQSLDEMLASRIIVQIPTQATASSKLDATSEEISAVPSPPYRRRSLWPTLHYRFGSTVGSPRQVWQSSKENCIRETSGEVNGSPHLSGANADTGLRRSSSSVASFHPRVIDMSFHESSIPIAASIATQERKKDDDEELSESTGASWDIISHGSAETNTLKESGSDRATALEDEEYWTGVAPSLSGASSSVRLFIEGLYEVRRYEH